MSDSQNNEKQCVQTAVNEGFSKITGSAASATVIHSELSVTGRGQ